MKIYLIYILPKNKLYAISDNKKYVKRFLLERNAKNFKVIKKKFDTDEYNDFLNENIRLRLYEIPLEDLSGNYTIIGTNIENYIIDSVCENIADSCFRFKVHFMENFTFNNEYKAVLDAMTTVSKNINEHLILQIDSMKLFYYLFKETFADYDQCVFIDEKSEYIKNLIDNFNFHF